MQFTVVLVLVLVLVPNPELDQPPRGQLLLWKKSPKLNPNPNPKVGTRVRVTLEFLILPVTEVPEVLEVLLPLPVLMTIGITIAIGM